MSSAWFYNRNFCSEGEYCFSQQEPWRNVSTAKEVKEFFDMRSGATVPTLNELRSAIAALEDIRVMPFEVWQERREEAERRQKCLQESQILY